MVIASIWLSLFLADMPVVDTIRSCLENRLFRSGAVLFQELCYRIAPTDETRRVLEAIKDNLRFEGTEPDYCWGYVWPHIVNQDDWSPFDRRTRQVQKDAGDDAVVIVEFGPLFSFLGVSTQIDEALRVPGLRTMRLSRDRNLVDQRRDLAECGKAVLDVAAQWRDERLVSALLCDAHGRERDETAKIAKVVRDWDLFGSISTKTIPPGCDTHPLSWDAHLQSRHRPSLAPEPTFGELLERVEAIAGKGGDSKRATTIIALEQPVPDVEFFENPVSLNIDDLLYSAKIRSATNWDNLLTKEERRTIASVGGRRLKRPIRAELQQQVFNLGKGAFTWQINEDGTVQIVRRPSEQDRLRSPPGGR